jgi:hypothetical protein
VSTGRLSAPVVILTLVLVASATGAVSTPAATPGGTDTSNCPSFNAPDELTLASGTPQSAKIQLPFAANLQVVLANGNGCPLTTPTAGIAVTFTAPTSGPSGTFSASGSNAVVVGADASGQAMAPQFTANSLPGGYQVVASSEVGSVSFFLVNTASGVPAKVVALAPERPSATVSNRYPRPLEAEVLDGTGAAVPGAAVTFTLGSGGGGGAQGGSGSGAGAAGATFIGGATEADEMTDASGIATSPALIADTTAGRFTATATAGSNVTATFALDNLASRPPGLAALGARSRSSTIGENYRRPLRVKLRTAEGGALQGATVTFTLGSGGGGGGAEGGSGSAGATFVGGASQVAATTNGKGIATSPAFTANTTAGRFVATATTTGTTHVASFQLDNLAGRPPTIVATHEHGYAAAVGDGYRAPLKVRIRQSGKPVQGATVTFTLGAAGGGAAAGGSGTAAAGATFVSGTNQATETTNASGVATSPALTANSVAGTFNATATTSGTTGAASFTLHNLAGKPATITAGAASGETATTATRFPIRLAVTVTDKQGNPVSGTLVTFAAPAFGPSGRFNGKARTVEVKTDAAGVAVAPPFLATHTQGGYVVRASIHGLSKPAAFALVNLPA